jgi:hypothetical protein
MIYEKYWCSGFFFFCIQELFKDSGYLVDALKYQLKAPRDFMVLAQPHSLQLFYLSRFTLGSLTFTPITYHEQL